MNQFIIVSDKKRNSFSEKIFKKIFDYDTFDLLSGKQAEEVIKRESHLCLLLDFKQPANLDMMDRLSLGTIKGLRVTIFKLKPFTASIVNFLIPLDLIDLFFPHDLRSQRESTPVNSSPSLQEK